MQQVASSYNKLELKELLINVEETKSFKFNGFKDVKTVLSWCDSKMQEAATGVWLFYIYINHLLSNAHFNNK